jgi:hypothetical protein
MVRPFKDDRLAFEISERDGFPVSIGCGKCGGRFADFGSFGMGNGWQAERTKCERYQGKFKHQSFPLCLGLFVGGVFPVYGFGNYAAGQ